MTDNRKSSMGDRTARRSPIGHEVGSDGDSAERPIVDEERDLVADDDEERAANDDDPEPDEAPFDDEEIFAEDEVDDSHLAPKTPRKVRAPKAARANKTKPAAAAAPTTSRPEAGDDADAELLEELDDDILKPNRPEDAEASGASGINTRTGRLLIVAALVVGLCFGVWYAGRPGAENEVSAQPTMAAETTKSQAEVEARISELTTVLSKASDKKSAESLDAHLELGVLLFDSGDLEGAYKHWQEVTSINPKEVKAWANLGFYYMSSDPPDTTSAIDAWQKVVDLEPNSELGIQAKSYIKSVQAATASPAATPSPTAGG